MSPHLLSPGFVAQVDLSSSQAEVQAKAQRESLQRGIEAQIKAMKQYLPSVTTAAGATTAAVGSRQVMMYVKQQLQAHMDMPDAGQALH